MTTTLIVLALLALGVGIVIWATRRKPDAHRPAQLPGETDTAWNDPMTRADPPPPRTDSDPRP